MKKTGFTLIELVVVMSILALLLAILSPILSNSRQRSRLVKCALNIKELLSAMSLYEAENSTLPYGFNDDTKLDEPLGGYAGNQQFDRMGWWWFNFIGDVYEKRQGEESVFWCPANQLKDSTFDGDILCGNYGVNQSICKVPPNRGFPSEFEGIPLAFTPILSPSETLLIVDSGYALVNWWHATIDPPQTRNTTFIENTSYIPGMRINSQKAIWPGQEYDAIDGRHPNKTLNIGFVDCHVENRKANELLVEKRQERYKNRSPLWSSK
jgi:prepilin-type N-terminal cleavage/methylation domain-containing protein/prepilin-type processing-associated H-X9-DG protein